MIIKTVTILAVVALCYAIPIEEALKGSAPLPENVPTKSAPLPETIPTKSEFIAEPVEKKAPSPTDEKAPGSKDDSDLKTDNTFWSSYYKYPVYSRYYDYEYIPRIRTYRYYEPATYTYWSSYWSESD